MESGARPGGLNNFGLGPLAWGSFFPDSLLSGVSGAKGLTKVCQGTSLVQPKAV